MTERILSRIHVGIVFATAVVLVAACTAGNEPIAGIDGSGSPSPAAVVAQGPIQGFGSIIVNDVRYDIDRAQIRINGSIVTEAELRIGQLVTVAGQFDSTTPTAVASSVDFEANIQGPVESIELDGNTLRVLGQKVLLSAATVIDLEGGTDSTLLETGIRVQVSGFVLADGSLAATRVQTLTASDDLRVIGSVRGLRQGELKFDVGDLTVDYGQALVIEGFPGGAPADGDRVLVEGSVIDAQGALVAIELKRLEIGLGSAAGEEAEVEGLITRFGSVTDFDVSGTPVTTSSSTRYEGGGPEDLQLNVKIEVEGQLDGQGTILADKVEVKDGGRVVGQ